MNKKRVIIARQSGKITLIEGPIPEIKYGSVLVRVHNSLVSPGSEVGGWRNLHNQQVVESEPKPFGYANAGIVEQVGNGVSRFKAGDRIACMGAGYALHSNYAVVPHNLCVPLPDNVNFAQGAYGHLAATAVHVYRRGQSGFGEFAAVVGLGVLGQLCAMIHQMAGSLVIGWDTIPFRTKIANNWGIDAIAIPGQEDEVELTQKFTTQQGLDTAVIAFGGDANQALQKLQKCFKFSPDGHLMGRLMIPGGAYFDFPRSITNMDICRVGRTGFGYHDEAWEFGNDYPPVVMRWTTQTNLKLCMRLISEGKLNVDTLTTHAIALEHAESKMAEIIQYPDKMLGVIFEMSSW